MRSVSWAATLFAISLTSFASAQDAPPPTRPYDGIQAGLDAFRLAEERRQASAGQQLFLNDQLKYWSGLPTSRGETIYYGSARPAYPAYGSATPVVPPANLDYAYAHGAQYWSQVRHRGRLGPLTVFEPWPYVPGDIYGYVYYPPMRQPIGQWQGQTGPNRWESHPVYDPPLTNYRPLPAVDSPLLNGTPYAPPPLPPTEPTKAAPPKAAADDSSPPPPPPAPHPSRGPRDY